MSQLVIAGPSVVHETIDGEVVVVDLDKGLYFSIDGVGAVVWGMVVGGSPVADILDWGTTAFTAHATAAGEIGAFIDDLKAKGLVADAADPVPVTEAEHAAPATYAPPVLNMYSDMEELLLLDPIHEVSDDAGWPHTPA